MTTLYWMTGAIGAGKSTLGAALAARLPRTLFIDGDFLLPGADDVPFAERIVQIKNLLLQTCLDLAERNQSAVIAYPVSAETASTLRQGLQQRNAELVVIGIQSLPSSTITRGYTSRQVQRQSEMTEFNGTGFADIMFQHPTGYLHDSIEALYQRIDAKSKIKG